MLLVEIKYNFSQSTKPVSGILPTNNKLDHLGTGVQAIAKLHNKKNVVVKTIQIRGKDDPVLAWVRLCMNHQDNPFFPKIYNVKIYPAKQQNPGAFIDEFNKSVKDDYAPIQGNGVMVLTMERLYDTNDSANTSIPLFQELGILPPNATPYFSRISGKITSIGNTGDKFENKVTRKKLQSSNNKQFNQAVRLLEPILSFPGNAIDLHAGNFMIRMSPSPHIVIVDPVTTHQSS